MSNEVNNHSTELRELVTTCNYLEIYKLISKPQPQHMADLLESSLVAKHKTLSDLCYKRLQNQRLGQITLKPDPELLEDKAANDAAKPLRISKKIIQLIFSSNQQNQPKKSYAGYAMALEDSNPN